MVEKGPKSHLNRVRQCRETLLGCVGLWRQKLAVNLTESEMSSAAVGRRTDKHRQSCLPTRPRERHFLCEETPCFLVTSHLTYPTSTSDLSHKPLRAPVGRPLVQNVGRGSMHPSREVYGEGTQKLIFIKTTYGMLLIYVISWFDILLNLET